MKKILFTSHTANFAKFNQPFIQDLRKQGYIVHYASAGEEPVTGVDKHIQVDFARSPYRLDKHWRAYQQLVPLLEAEDYDLIHTHTPVGGVVTRLAAKKLQKKTPLLYTAHGFHFYKGASLLNWLLFYPVEKWLARDTDVLLTINHEDENLAKRKFRAGRVERLDGVGVNLEKFHPVGVAEKQQLRLEQGLAAEDFVLIYVAELNKNKDQEFIIRSVPELMREIPSLKVLLVSAGALREKLEKLVAELGLGEAVQFLGYRKDVDKLYQLADVVISASRREGLGLNVIEGMASGLPAVVRDNRGHREIVTDQAVGRVFHNRAEFVQAITWLYEHPTERRKMGEKAAQSVEKFSLEKARAKMGKIYQDFLEK